MTVNGSIAYWHLRAQQTLCGSWLGSSAATSQRVRVTDAGDPVPGARVQVDGRTFIANERGEVQYTVAPGPHRISGS